MKEELKQRCEGCEEGLMLVPETEEYKAHHRTKEGLMAIRKIGEQYQGMICLRRKGR